MTTNTCPNRPSKSNACFEVAGDRKVVAGLAGEIGNGAAGCDGAQAAAGDEVEAEGENAASLQDATADGAGNVETVF